MTQMVSVQIRFPSEELRRIDGLVERGEYHSRADYIRDAVRKAEMIQALFDIRRIMEAEGMTEEELLRGLKELREEMFSREFEETKKPGARDHQK